MSVNREHVARVVEFRNRLVAFLNYLDKHRPEYGEDFKPAARQHVGMESSALAQDYGRVYNVIRQPYGLVQLIQFNRVMSQDVIRDTISALDFPDYQSLAKMAVSHLDQVIGHLRAEVENAPARRGDDIVRLTSIAFWIGRLFALLRWFVTTNKGRIVGAIALLVTAVVGGIASGLAQGWYEQLTSTPIPSG